MLIVNSNSTPIIDTIPLPPFVSICVITYNHEKYIRQCLDGILMQEVNFPYEILIHDDASPDNTANIIREYEKKYPHIIKPIYQTINQYSLRNPITRLNLERAQGIYIAQCEGDDYWTDPHKLQKQIDFLESHPEYIGTAHNVRVVDENCIDVPKEMNQYPHYKEHIFTLKDAEYMRLAGQSASHVFRNYYVSSPKEMLDDYYLCRGIGDRKFTVRLTLLGDIFCFDDVMSAYRYVTSSGTSWTAQTRGKNLCDLMNNYYIDMKHFAEKWFSVDVNFEPQMIINFMEAGKRVLWSRKKEDVTVLLSIVVQPAFWRIMIHGIFTRPFDILQRCIKILRLPKVSAVTY